MTKNSKVSLEPPDRSRCQAVIKRYKPFILGGQVIEEQQCENKPAFIAKELTPGDDGLKGSMSLCAKCKTEFEKTRVLNIKFQPLK